MMGNFGAKHGMSASTRVAVVSFWEYAAFVANSLIFLLIGLDIHPLELMKDWPAIVLVWLAMLASRALFVVPTLPQIARLEGGLPRGFGLVVAWGGVRGGIAMVLALSIPREFALRELALHCIFGASLLTILVQSTTMGTLLRRLGLASDRRAFEIVESLRGRLRALVAARSYLERQRELGVIPEAVYEQFSAELKGEAEALLRERSEASELVERVRQEEIHALRRKLLLVRKESLRQAQADGAIDDRVMRRLVDALDEELHHVDLAHHNAGVEGGGAVGDERGDERGEEREGTRGEG